MNALPSLIKLESIERNHKIIASIVTAIIIVLLLLLCFFWRAVRPDYVSIGEHELEMIAGVGEGDGAGTSVDHGDNREGNQKINNFKPATENPIPDAPALPKVSAPTQVPTPAPPKAAAAPAASVKTAPSAEKPVLAGNDKDSPVNVNPKDKVNDKKETPTSSKTTKADTPKPQGNDAKPTTPTTTTTPASPSTTKSSTSTASTPAGGGGSNHGKGGTVGNTGAPQINALNIDGLEWGSGDGKGGSGGGLNRQAIKVFKPKYDVQEEGKVTFEFYISPEGGVVNCKALPNRVPSLAKIGMETISQWKFNKIAANSPNQKVLVTFTFKLNN